ncbi:MAG: hypothetical protein EOO45_05010 [Flavobacterium sp.]|nr:MAG: hypothetical protein EOO45_05010 [Flavobacterium sp.]
MTNDTPQNNLPPEPPEVTRLWDIFGAEDFEGTIIEAEKYIESNRSADYYDAKKLIGLSAFRLGRYDKSEQVFSSLAEGNGTMEEWFNLLTSSTMNNNIELSERALDKIVDAFRTATENPGITLPQVYFYYLQALRDVRHYDKAFAILTNLMNYHLQVKITDTHFLYVRGIPLLPDTLFAGKQILENVAPEKSKHLLDQLENGLDEEGREFIVDFRKSLQ